MTGLTTLLAAIWRLALPYFRSEDRWTGRLLLAMVIGIELAIVAINVLINQWNARFYNALQDRNWDTFVSELLFFCALAAIYIVLAVYQLYLNQWLQIRWRRWMTKDYLDRWLANSTHYRMQLLGDPADNPDQRIAEDVNLFIERTLYIVIKVLGAVVTLLSFIAILWSLSETAPLTIGGAVWAIPGYLVWAALIYAFVGTALTHWIGWPLAGLNFQQQRYEADFRFNLVRVRENSEQIALLRGEDTETDRLLDRFGRVVTNWMQIMSRLKKLTFLTAGYSQISIIFPYVVVSPAYFSGAMQLGGLMQTANAFSSVQTSLSVFIDVYRQLAEWAAVVERLAGFDRSIDQTQKVVAASTLAMKAGRGKDGIALDDLHLDLPNGKPLVSADAARFEGKHTLVTGPSGSGKSTLFRAIAGLWPFGRGDIRIPDNARVMILPQRPYFPVGPLASAIAYPAAPEAFTDAQLADALRAVGLPALIVRLHEDAHWNRLLSLGEQQRLGIARALLQKPDFLFLDEATASLDEASEAALYKLLQKELANTAIISIGHRSTLSAFHQRHLKLAPDESRHRLREAEVATP
ncbi:MAG: ABC transporter ATP-binding protein/permease [Pseudorhodoplanes sp.]|nr:ABC transporter ATP-binding protein/permease [Pseudorhodoplanes sp.]